MSISAKENKGDRKFLFGFLFISAIVFLFFFELHKIPLWSSDEGRYGEIAREMWETKNFFNPTFNYLPYLEKPILAPLLTVLSYLFFGVNSLSARLPSVIAALSGIFLTYCFTRKLFNERVAIFSALFLATSVGYVLVGRFAVIDMLMTLFLSAAIFCLMAACLEKQRKFYFFAYFFMGIAFWTKGLIGILLPLLIVLVFLIWTKNLREIKRMSLGWGVVIVGVFIAALIGIVSLKEPEFFKVFIVEHHFERFATGTFGRKKPFWFFVPILASLSFPWSFFIPAAMIKGFRQPEKWIRIQFLISWIAVIFIFFSIPSSKLPYYLLPVSVPVAILVALLFDEISAHDLSSEIRKILNITWNVILGACVAGVFVLAGYLFFGMSPIKARGDQVLALRPILCASSLCLLTGVVTAYFFHKKNCFTKAIWTLSFTIWIFLLLVFEGMKVISPYESSFDFAKTLSSFLKPEDKVAIYSSPDHFSDFPFHLGRRVIIVGTNRGTLTAQSKASEYREEVKDWFLKESAFLEFFDHRKVRIFCLMEEERLVHLKSMGLKEYTLIKQGFGKILISNLN